MGTEKSASNGAESSDIHSLILKIWRRRGDSSAVQPQWHGQITNVPSGEQLYANNPNDLLTKVAIQLRRFGIPLTLCWRLKCWMHERKQRSRREAS